MTFASYAFYESTYQCLVDLKDKLELREEEGASERERKYRTKCLAIMANLAEEFEG